MAHPLVWPGKYHFYPIGNTPAVCLTRDLAPEEHANILLLGCGDPRNILYTIFCEPEATALDRRLDFTCCDNDPAVLARNLLLLTMVADGKHSRAAIWNIFFHVYIDKESHAVLVEHCRKLIEFSDSPQRWNASPYARVLKMCTNYTLVEVRRHWSLYVGMHDLPDQRIKTIRDAFTAQSKSITRTRDVELVLSSARSAGPLMSRAIGVFSEHYRRYWETGVTFSDPAQIATATMLNPTFAYSLGGEGCAIHYGTDPLVPFHFAATFGNANGTITIPDIVKAAKTQFRNWCLAFQNSISVEVTNVPIIRFFLGEATAVCRALRGFAMTRDLSSGIPVDQWKTQRIHLSKDQYGSQGHAPTSFNVIDTSNLDDHIGLLNVLIATAPILSPSASSSVLYTESLLVHGENATKDFAERLYANVTTVSVLLDLCPVDYLSGFTTRSNFHELLAYKVVGSTAESGNRQFHQVTTWKAPASGDAIAVQGPRKHEPLTFDPRELGTFLYDMYRQLFDHETFSQLQNPDRMNVMRAITKGNLVHYIRESYVLLLKIFRDRIGASDEQWLGIMDRFIHLQIADKSDKSLPIDDFHKHDLWTQLHRHGLYTISEPSYRPSLPKTGRFANWDTIPTLVRIILVVPREKLAPQQKYLDRNVTPSLQCDIRSGGYRNTFSAVHVAFGRVIPFGTNTSPQVSFQEDPDAWKGSMPLVASFVVPAGLLLQVKPQEHVYVSLSVRSTPATYFLISDLGDQLIIFKTNLLDLDLVHVLPEQPLPSRKLEPQTSSPISPTSSSGFFTHIGKSRGTAVELDEECEMITYLTSGFSIENKEVKHLFGIEKATPQVEQVSPCVMRVTIGNYIQDVRYPFPIIGSQHKLRCARKSLYVEVVVPISGPFKPDGMKIYPYPVVRTNDTTKAWGIHRVALSRMPMLDIQAPDLYGWLNPHVSSAMSARERSLKKKGKEDVLMFVKDTLHTILVRSSGIQGGSVRRVFALRDKPTTECDTLFFVAELRFDLSSHTMVCDGYVLPLIPELMYKIQGAFSQLVTHQEICNVSVFKGEMRAWKQLLPALVERCRSSWVHGVNCEYRSQSKIPLSEELHSDPLCSCGRGKDVEGMSKVDNWKDLAPHVTRVALSSLFAVSYLEPVIRDPRNHRCFLCRAKGNPKLKKCTGCMKVRYCSEACQRNDWKVHRKRCNSKV